MFALRVEHCVIVNTTKIKTDKKQIRLRQRHTHPA